MKPEDKIRLQNIQWDKPLIEEKVKSFQMERLAATLGAILVIVFYLILNS